MKNSARKPATQGKGLQRLKMIVSFVKHSTTSRKKPDPMLSLSVLGKSGSSAPSSHAPSPSPSSSSNNTTPSKLRTSKPSPSKSSTTSSSSSSSPTKLRPSASSLMKTSGDARSEAVTFLGLLRHNEDLLAERTKQLAKTNRQHVRDVFTTLVGEWTPFHACTLRGARKLVKTALKSGVPPDLEMGSPEGLPARCSPLHLAAHRGDVSLVQLLVQHGACLDKRDSTGRTPLFYAAAKNNVLAARKLIKYGADVAELTGEQRIYYKEDIERRPSSLLCIPVPGVGGSR